MITVTLKVILVKLRGSMQERAAEISGNGLTAQSSGSFAFTAIERYIFSTLGEHDCFQRALMNGRTAETQGVKWRK